MTPKIWKTRIFVNLNNSALETDFQRVVIHISVDLCSWEIEFIPIFGHNGHTLYSIGVPTPRK